MICRSLFRRCSRWFAPGLGGGLAGLVICLAGTLPGCQPPVENVVMGTNGPIRMHTITRIVNDQNLTEDQKRQELRDLGITDEELIDTLIRGV